MRQSQTLELELSEKRSELAAVTSTLNKAAEEGKDAEANDISKADTLTREIRSLEIRKRAAIISEEQEDTEARAGDGLDAEHREFMEIRGRSQLHSFIVAAREMRAVDGAEGELLDAMKIGRVGPNGGAAFPLAMLAPEPRREVRTTTDTDTSLAQQTWLDRLFAGTAAAHIGISFQSVPAGEASFPITSAGAAFGQVAREAAIGDAAWVVGVTKAEPKRGGVRAKFTMEDAARIPGLEGALQRDLRAALTEGVDRAVFLGDATANAVITGLDDAAITEVTLTQANKVKWPETLQAFIGMLDGKHAMEPSDLNIVASVGASRLWYGTQANSNRNESVAQVMRGNGLSWMTRGEIDTNTANGDFGAFVGRARGIAGAGVAAVWNAGEMLRDPYTGSATGEVAITLSYLWDFVLPRLASFRRLKFVT